MYDSIVDKYLASSRKKMRHEGVSVYCKTVGDENGNAIVYCGDSLVFKIYNEENGETSAMKFILRDEEDASLRYHQICKVMEGVESPYFVKFDYYEDMSDREADRLPMLLMDWVEGVTLDRYVQEHIDDSYQLQLLAYRFGEMAWWLMSQPFAHGNLHPKNILVTSDGNLKLVDYDAMYVPAMSGKRATNLGNPDYCHPLRTLEEFDERIDDFALVTMALSLKAIALKPQLWNEFGGDGRLLFGAEDYRDLSQSKVWQAVGMLEDEEVRRMMDLFDKVYAERRLTIGDWGALRLLHPMANLKYTIEERLGDNVDEKYLFRIRLSNGSPLYFQSTEYPGTLMVCAQCYYQDYEGEEYFCNEDEKAPFGDVVIPAEIEYHDKWYRVVKLEMCAFMGCKSLRSVVIPHSVEKIEDEAFKGCVALERVVIPDSVREIGGHSFEGCASLKCVKLPSHLGTLKWGLFNQCTSLQRVTIPASVRRFDGAAFEGCEALEWVDMKARVKEIPQEMFKGCRRLRYFYLSNEIEWIGKEAFAGCSALQDVALPRGLRGLEVGAFKGCKGLNVVVTSRLLHNIPSDAFKGCTKLERVIVTTGFGEIGSGAFEGCTKLKYLVALDSIGTISSRAFRGCRSLIKIKVASSVGTIHCKAFEDCIALNRVELESSVGLIDVDAFKGCEALKEVLLPTAKSHNDGAFPAHTKITYYSQTRQKRSKK